MRPEVEENRTGGLPPRRRERGAAERAASQHRGAQVPERSTGRRPQKVPHLPGEAVGQHQLGRDTGVVGSVRDGPRIGDGEPNRLLQQQVLAGPGRRHGEGCLDVGGDGERHRIAGSQQVVKGVDRGSAVLVRQRLGGGARRAHTAANVRPEAEASIGAVNRPAHGPAPTSPTRIIAAHR